MQYLWRLVVAAVVFTVLILVVLPALAALLGMPVTGALVQVLKGCAILLALGYILWGAPVVPG
jgi:hypothetical protein